MKIRLIILLFIAFFTNLTIAQLEIIPAIRNYGTNDNFYNILNQTSCIIKNSSILPLPIKLSDNKYKMIMSLPKTTYKKYEPVVAKFDLINNDTLPLDIYYDIFWIEANYLFTIKVVDNLGKIYSVNQTPGDMMIVYKAPDYIIQPGDTFIISMPINNWGKENDTRHLGQFGYFPSGQTYEARFSNEQLTSNIVKFDVIELNKYDNDLLNLLNNWAVSESTLQMYEDNPFVEHIYAKYFLKSVENYYDFLTKYPSSYYMYYDRYMSKLYTTQFIDEKNIEKIISNIKTSISSDQFNQFLSNRAIQERVNEILKMYKPRNKKMQ